MPPTALLMKPITFSTSAQPSDVEIELGDTILQVHSSILRHNSPFFEASLSERWWQDNKDPNASSNSGNIRYKYKVVKDDDGDWALYATHKLPPETAKINTDVPSETIKTWILLFQAMYHKLNQDKLSSGVCQSLAQLADMYGDVACVRAYIESYFLNNYTRIGENIQSVLAISTTIRSKPIYEKAFLQLVDLLINYQNREYPGIPDFTMARAYKGTYLKCPKHGCSYTGCGTCPAQRRQKLSQEYPWKI